MRPNAHGREDGPILRPAAAADIPAITAIYAGAVTAGTASFEWDPPTETVMAERMAALAARRAPYLVAERDGAVLGYAYAGPYRPRPAYGWTVEDSIYVAPQAAGKGVGKALLGALIARSEALGYRQMVAVIVESGGAQASVGLHRALGFREAGRFEQVGWKQGRWLSTLLMQRPLGEGAATPPR